MIADRLIVHIDVDTLVVPADFTRAEREVLLLVMEGLSNEEIAQRRQRSARTIANQLAAMMRKVGVFNRTELLARCAPVQPKQTSSAWNEFIEGRWRVTAFEQIDRVLRCVAEPSERPLTHEERLVVEEAAVGTPNKLLGDVLQRGEAAASKCLERALRKLGAVRRSQLPMLRVVFA